MKLQQKVRYGVACLYELSKFTGEYAPTEVISHNQNIPCAYAHKILQMLSHCGLVLAYKGLGYKLARPLADISVAEVMDILAAEPEPALSTSLIGNLLENKIHQALNSCSLGEIFQTL